MKRLSALKKIYEVHDEYTKEKHFFCHKGCGSCCTINLAITSLEAQLILNNIGTSLKCEVEKFIKFERFQPKTTTNGLANIFISGGEAPDEFMPDNTEKCPFLDRSSSECMIYDIRPLQCRIMLSISDCGINHEAELDEKKITINSVFQQYVELLDYDGLTGNMIDLLVHGTNPIFTSKFVDNQKPKALMIPPEFHEMTKPLILKLNSIFNSL